MKKDLKTQIRATIMLFIAALIWGSAFVAQSQGMEFVGPFTFAAVRFLIGGTVLIPLVAFMKKRDTGSAALFDDYDKSTGLKGYFEKHKLLFTGSLFAGIALTFATNFQQQGIKYVSSVGKAGFITTLYIVLVPVFSLFIKKKVRPLIWVALAFSVLGLYFLCVTEKLTIEPLDILLVLCAAFFAIQIIIIDNYAERVNPIALSSIQFLVVGVLSSVCMFMFEKPTISGIIAAMGPILYAGVLSSGVAFTLQVLAQKDLDPTLASMLMSLESVVSVLSGFLILHQVLTGREIAGCVLMFVGVILAQLPEKTKKG